MQDRALIFWRQWRQRFGAGDGGHPVSGSRREGAPPAPAEAAALFERLDHLLSLADQCPPSASASRLRRSVYESIEAASLTDRRRHLGRVLREIEGLRRHHLAGGHRAAAGASMGVERLLTALHAAVVRILAPETAPPAD